MRRLMRFAAIGFTTVLLAGCIALPDQRFGADLHDPSVYVVELGWHTGIALPVEQLIGSSAALKDYFPGAKYLLFGFGDRHYLMTERTAFEDVVAAMFPGPSALFVTALAEPPAEALKDASVIGLYAPNGGMAKMSHFLWRYFEKDQTGKPVLLGDGPDPGSRFYASSGIYDAFHTCNTWSAEMLRQGGFSINANGVVFTDQILRQVLAKSGP
jgi:uncharacterized protein (TIGR02117 family)